MTKPHLAVTLGDPAGIGCEIVCRAVSSSAVKGVCSPVVFGDKQSLKQNLFKYLKNRMPFEFVESSNIGDSVKIGIPSKEAGIISASAIYKAVKYCADGKALALVTAPVSKESLKMAGINIRDIQKCLPLLPKVKKLR